MKNIYIFDSQLHLVQFFTADYTGLMETCVFCKIAKGEIPSYKVYEDPDFLAFLDIAPLNLGQTLVIPKKHYRWTWDVPNFGEYWEVAGKVAKAQIKSLDAKMVEFLTHGMDVTHAHIWVVPIYKDEVFIDTSERKKFDEVKMKETAAKISTKLSKS
jgi:histidine triad (HIT) family protein